MVFYNREQRTHTETRPFNTPSFAWNCWISRLIWISVPWVNRTCTGRLLRDSLILNLLDIAFQNVPWIATPKTSRLVFTQTFSTQQEHKKCHSLKQRTAKAYGNSVSHYCFPLPSVPVYSFFPLLFISLLSCTVVKKALLNLNKTF